jgi:hypothetical protein
LTEFEAFLKKESSFYGVWENEDFGRGR